MKHVVTLGLLALVAATLAGREVSAGGRQGAPQIQVTDPTLRSRDNPEMERRDQVATAEDLLILTKASSLLSDESVWNRADDRVCEDDEATGRRSLFCALQKACVDVLGAYDHRRVALQEVRFAVDDATRGQDFEHRLRDFNNLPATRLADIQAVLKVAIDRVKSRLPSK
jgi:hypothetical protein